MKKYIQKELHTGDYVIIDERNNVLDRISGVASAYGLDRSKLLEGNLVEFKGKFTIKEYPKSMTPVLYFY